MGLSKLCTAAAGLERLLLTPHCPLCQDHLNGHSYAGICPACRRQLASSAMAACPLCGRPMLGTSHICGYCVRQPPPQTRTYSLGPYEGQLQQLIQHYKFTPRLALQRPLARLLVRHLHRQAPQQPWQRIIAVPLHHRRLAQRGFNQATQLAKEMAPLLKLPRPQEILLRQRHTASQRGLSQAQRQANMAGAFCCQQPFQGDSLLLVDDVLTTGATVAACVRTLLDAGASEVQVAVLAVTPRHHPATDPTPLW